MVSYIARTILGLLLAALTVTYWRWVWSVFFGLDSRWPSLWVGWRGLLVMFGVVLCGMLGVGMLAWVCANLLVAVRIKITCAPIELALAAGWAGTLVFPTALYYWTRRQFRSVMATMSPRCEQCDYSLRGLPIRRGHIRCPECGHRNHARTVLKRFQHDRRVLAASKKEPWDLS